VEVLSYRGGIMNKTDRKIMDRIRENKKEMEEMEKIANEPFPSTAPGCAIISRDGIYDSPSGHVLRLTGENETLRDLLQ